MSGRRRSTEGEATRTRILERFDQRPGAHLTPAALAAELGKTQQNVAYHCRVLTNDGELEEVEPAGDDGSFTYRRAGVAK